MKKVFKNTDEVIHVFAQRTQYEGRNQSGNVFFYGDKIYSYGHHYLLGQFIDDNTILINDRGYSRTTQKHISALSYATNHYKQFFATQSDVELVYNEVNKLLKKIEGARKPQTKEGYINSVVYLAHKLNEYHQFNKDTQTIEGDKFKSVMRYAEIVKDETQLFGLERVLNFAKRQTRQFNKHKAQEQITKFYEGAINYLNNIPHALLRLSKEGDTIETSRGASVPLNEAKILYHRIKAGKCIKGFKIGYYTTIGIKDDTIKIGCHDIKLDEVHKLSEVLN
jgi:hypothetical protein